MGRIKIAIKSDRDNILNYREYLERYGFVFDGTKFVKTCKNDKEADWAKRFSKANHLIFFYDNAYGERSGNYRDTYFKNNRPDIRGRYRCVYCGRKLKRGRITVDHLYPVSVVSKDLKLQKKLKKHGIPSLNDKNNLVAACWECNAEKGTQMGRWIWKGRIGRHGAYWKVRNLTKVLIIVFAAYLVVCIAMAIRTGSWNRFLEAPVAMFMTWIAR